MEYDVSVWAIRVDVDTKATLYSNFNHMIGIIEKIKWVQEQNIVVPQRVT